MDNRNKKKRFYTFMIVPHDAQGRPIGFKVPASWVHTAVFLAVFSLLVVGSSIVYSTLLSRRLVHYADTLSQNKKQQEVISSFSVKTEKVARQIDELVRKDNELRKLLGLKGWDLRERVTITAEVKPNKVSVDFDRFDDRLTERRKSLDELKAWVNVVRSRFASTPSTWPIYGQLVSFFGYRSYPWRGFHSGVDIKASYGVPARSTAAGIVTFTGWRRGYGKLVEVSHGNGYSTYYAHASGYAVRTGQKVRKGQVVCYVGTTGWTTGPHLHYEVRRWDRAVNPVAYLDLNIMTASRLWR